MAEEFNFKSEWEKTKKQFNELSRNIAVIVEKGEKEAVKLAQKSKLHVDSAKANLRVEQLCYLIGKEFLKLRDITKPNQRLSAMVEEARSLLKEQKQLKQKIKKV
jgi:hypothetical protein